MSGAPLPVTARVAVARLVWLGFDTVEDIVSRLCAAAAPGDPTNPDSVRAEIASVLEKKAAEEANWPEEIAVERLQRVYEVLEEANVVGLHDAGAGQESGLEEIAEVWTEQGGESSGLEGYCFYHRQDLEHALSEQDLYLFFGVLPPMSASQAADLTEHEWRTLQIGRIVERCCREAGFDVQWDGTTRKRIRLLHFDPRDRGMPEEDDEE